MIMKDFDFSEIKKNSNINQSILNNIINVLDNIDIFFINHYYNFSHFNDIFTLDHFYENKNEFLVANSIDIRRSIIELSNPLSNDYQIILIAKRKLQYHIRKFRNKTPLIISSSINTTRDASILIEDAIYPEEIDNVLYECIDPNDKVLLQKIKNIKRIHNLFLTLSDEYITSAEIFLNVIKNIRIDNLIILEWFVSKEFKNIPFDLEDRCNIDKLIFSSPLILAFGDTILKYINPKQIIFNKSEFQNIIYNDDKKLFYDRYFQKYGINYNDLKTIDINLSRYNIKNIIEYLENELLA